MIPVPQAFLHAFFANILGPLALNFLNSLKFSDPEANGALLAAPQPQRARESQSAKAAIGPNPACTVPNKATIFLHAPGRGKRRPYIPRPQWARKIQSAKAAIGTNPA